MKIEPNEIHQLLRQRRDNLPSQDYFDDFLSEFQRRQRAELLQQPTLALLWERANIWLDGFRVPALAYASIVVAAVGLTGIMLSGGDDQSTASATIASANPAGLTLPTGSSVPVAQVSTNLPPSYVLENRPVPNDRPFSF